jgi:hypothetical protein
VTVVMQQTMPNEITLEFLDRVTQEMGVETDPPAGLIVHTHFDDDGRVQVIDVWDSQEAFESFRDQRLLPAMQKLAAERGIDMMQAPPPEATVTPVHGLVRGR